MSELLPPNIADAYRAELAGLERRLLRVDDPDLRARLEARVAALRANLGETAEKPVRGRRKANGVEVRPDDGDTEVR